MNNNTFLGVFIDHCVDALRPLTDALNDPNEFGQLMYDLGWDIENLPVAQVTPIVNALNDLINTYNSLPASPTEADILELLEKVGAVYVAVQSNVSSIASNLTGLGTLASTFIAEFPGRLLEYLIVNYINKELPLIYSVLELLGVIEYEDIAEAPPRPGYVRIKLNYDRIPQIVTNPASLLQGTVGWNGSNYLFSQITELLLDLFAGIGITAEAYRIDPISNPYTGLFAGSTTVSEGVAIYPARLPAVDKPIVVRFVESIGSTLGDTGFILQIDIPSGISFTETINDNLSLTLSASVAIGDSLVFCITPNGLQFKFLGQPSAGFPSTDIKAVLNYEPDQPKLIFGKAQGTRLQLSKGSVGLEAKYNGDVEIIADADLSGLSFILNPGDSDGFIKKVFGDGEKQINLPIAIGWSSKHGITFKGSGAFEVAVTPNINLGPIHIDQALIALKSPSGSDTVKTEIGATISGMLGPISFIVENIGISLDIKTTAGNAGPFGINLGFKPPNGIGLKIKASVVEGGGYLYIDKDKGRYYGAVELKIANKLGLTAVGIVTTKNPDGSDGFSLLVLICVTFAPSIPIGFGFSLSGVGGMVGVNRSMAPEPLRQGVKTGAIDHILFPQNVIENIQTIITDLDQIFPIQKDRYTFGLFFLLGWGVPTPLIKIKMGVIIEVPSPVKLAIIGTISLKLPSEDKAILQLNVAFAGIIDFDKKYLTFDASIYDSKILTFSLYGDMAVRVFWGEHREILISVGGFHPAYNPPAYLLLPAKMDRLTISIFDKDNLKLQLATYFAVTSNTVQFGARLDFLFKVSKFKVVGIFGFDVLFQFNPFKFRTDVYAMLAVKWGSRELMSLSLDFMLEGPGPWHAKGNASFKVLFIKCKVKFDKTWGPQPATSLPDVAVLPLITADIQKPENWLAALPDQKKLLVQIKELPATDIVLHPLGTLSITQKIAPLGVKLERFGNQKPSDGGTYDITSVKVQTVTQPTETALDSFAPAQFRNMNDDQKLKASSFEYLRAGVKLKSLSGSELYMDAYATKEVEYERILIDNVHYDKQRYKFKRALLNDFIYGGLVSANTISRQFRTDFSSPIVKAGMVRESYQLVSKDSLKELSTITGSGIADTTKGSRADAFTLMEQLVQQNPALAGKIQAVPVY